MAKNYDRIDMTDRAIKGLKDVIKRYPDHLEAKDLLKKLQ